MSENHQPLVSVIIPVRNRAEQLEAAMLSVLSQKEGIAELVIIDGGSTDGTLDVIRKYADRIAYWVSEPDKGIYDAMNKGIRHARGKYAIFLGSDDILIVQLDKLEGILSDPRTIYYGDFRTLAGPACNDGFNARRLAVETINHQSIFYPMAAFEKEAYSTKYSVSGDWEFNMRCYGDRTLKFQYVPHEIAFYSRGGFSSQVTDHVFLNDRLRLVRKYLPFHVYMYAMVRTNVARLLGIR
jgi:glycosyltransferase involved in cell wall biosynthesis